MKILITGGAGYIGSHLALDLIDQKFEVAILDDLSSGFKNMVNKSAKFIQGDYGDIQLVDNIFKNNHYDAVVHLAGSLKVEESVKNPFLYYKNNTEKTLNFVNYLSKSKCRNLIFSSTASVYDSTPNGKADEKAKLNPCHPYGHSKLMCERIIQDIAKISKLKYFILRYFNVAGADYLGRAGQMSQNATHLIKVCIECAVKKRPFLEVYGNDYATYDGTCLRDYIHISDLISGHSIALHHLINGGKSDICNLGYGKAISVLDIVKTVKKISSYDFVVKIKGRRDGDPPILISNPDKMIKKYNWQPSYNKIDQIIQSAFDWEIKNNAKN